MGTSKLINGKLEMLEPLNFIENLLKVLFSVMSTGSNQQSTSNEMITMKEVSSSYKQKEYFFNFNCFNPKKKNTLTISDNSKSYSDREYFQNQNTNFIDLEFLSTYFNLDVMTQLVQSKIITRFIFPRRVQPKSFIPSIRFVQTFDEFFF